MASNYTGGCQCGDVRYEVTGAPRRLIACHCADCQRQSGSAFGMTMVVSQSDFRILKGELKTFTSTSDAGRGKLGAFCPRCGTRIFHKPEVRPLHTDVPVPRSTWMCESGPGSCPSSQEPWTTRHG